MQRFYQQIPGHDYGGAGGFECDVAATGFALLPLLGDGHTHLSGQYQLAVSRGLSWLLAQQKPDGELSGKLGRNCRMYAHAIAAIVLCEAYGMTKDPKLAIRRSGPWTSSWPRSTSPQAAGATIRKQAADTSVVGWQVMAMKSGQMAALNVSQDSLDLVHKWLRSVEGKGAGIGTFRYQGSYQITPAMTAEGLLCLEYLGAQPGDPRLQSGVKYLLAAPAAQGGRNELLLVLRHPGHVSCPGRRLAAVESGPPRHARGQTQVKTGHLAGTWDPADQWDYQAGRIYASSLRLLALEVYFRHLPLYRLSEP